MTPYLVIDIETYDPNLSELGAGVQRKDGYVLGVAVYSPYLRVHQYIPLGHEEVSDGQYRANREFLQELLDSNTTKVFHNSMYDLDWLINGEKLRIPGKWVDTMDREVLLDAHRPSYSLDAVCGYYGIEGKLKGGLQEWCDRNGRRGDPRKWLREMPMQMVGDYAKQDVYCTGQVYEAQEPLIQSEGVGQVADIESRLKPLLVRMKARGVKVDEARRQEVSRQLHTELDAGLDAMEHTYGFRPNFNKASDFIKIWEQEGISLRH